MIMKLLKNEKGSVLSAGIIIIAIITLSLSTVTAQTYNIASRTSTTISNEDEGIYARTILQSALQDIRIYIYDNDFQKFEDFGPLDDMKLETMETEYNLLINEFYETSSMTNNHTPVFETNIETEPSSDGDRLTRQYQVSYTLTNGRTLTRQLYIELSEQDSTTGDHDLSTIDGVQDYLKNTYIVEEEMEALDVDTFKSENLEDSPDAGDLEGNMFVEGELDVSSFNSGNSSSFGFGDYFMYVNGNLTFDNVTEIRGPGIIFVEGNLTLKAGFPLELNMDLTSPLLFIVTEDLVIDIDGNGNDKQRSLKGENYHFLVGGDIDTKNTNNPDDYPYYERSYNEQTPKYEYLGTNDDMDGLSEALDYYSHIFGDAGFSDVFNYFESSVD